MNQEQMSQSQSNQQNQPKKTSPVIWVVFVILAVLIIGGFGWYAYSTMQPEEEVVITPTKKSTPTATSTVSPTPTADKTADWRVYTNKKYGYSIKYPSDWIIKTSGNDILVQNKKGDIYASNEGVESGNKVKGSFITISSANKDNSQTLENYLKSVFYENDNAVFEKITINTYSGLKLKDLDEIWPGDIMIHVNNDNQVVSLTLNISDDSETTASTNIFNKMLSTFKFTK